MRQRFIFHKISLVLSIIILLLCLTFAVARAYNAVTESKVDYKTIQEALNIKNTTWSMVHWQLDEPVIGRSLGAGDAYMIGQAYTKSMQALSAASASGLTADLAEHFTGQAHSRTVEAVKDAGKNHHMIVMAADAKANIFTLMARLLISTQRMCSQYALMRASLKRRSIYLKNVKM